MTTVGELRYLLACEDRLAVVAALQRIDPNGIYDDADMQAEGWEPMTLAQARDTLRGWIRDEEERTAAIPEHVEQAYQAWQKACDIPFRSTSRMTNPAAEQRKQDRINRLRIRYETLLRAWKVGAS